MPGWWVTDLWARNPIILAAVVFWVVWSIVLHELAHGWAALWAGDDTPRATGHMTLNPVVHMGVPALVLFALVGITWGSMPVNPSRFRRSIHEVVVLAAGPAMNVVLFLVCAFITAFWVAFGRKLGLQDHVYDNVLTFIAEGAQINVVLALLNLLPLPVLDGGRILAYFVPPLRQFYSTGQGMIISILIMVVVFGAIGPVFWRAGDEATYFVVKNLAGLLRGTP